MTKVETMAVMAVLKAAYPAYYKGQNKQELTNVVDLWAELFADDDFNAVKAAVKAHIASDTKGFPPVIGQIKEKLNMITYPAQITEQTAWALVNKAIKNSAYHATEEYEKLPDVVKKAIGGPSQLRDWALSENDGAQTVIASNFMRSYRTAAERERQYQALPADVKKLIENAMPMIGGGDNENGKNDRSGIPENGQKK